MENLPSIEHKNNFDNWYKSDLKDEAGEFERVFDMVYGESILNNQNMIDFIKSEYSKNEPTELTSDLWLKLENSDSYDFEKGEIQKNGRNDGFC